MSAPNQKPDLSIDTSIDAGRRCAIRKIVAGVGVLASYSVLPDSWTTPIIGQIALPAHAATSGSTLKDPCTVEQRGGGPKTETVTIKVTGFVTPPVANLSVLISVTAIGGSNSSIEVRTLTRDDGTFEAYLVVSGGPGITRIDVVTTVVGADGVARCSVTTNEGPAEFVPVEPLPELPNFVN